MIALGIFNAIKQEHHRRRHLRLAMDELQAECAAEVDLAYKEYAETCSKIVLNMTQSFFDRSLTDDEAKAKADRDAEIALLRYEQRVDNANETFERKLNSLLRNY